MIRGAHTMFYSSEPEAFRAFVRDKLGFPATDVGGGWLIFDLPEADLGCHPVEKGEAAGPPSGTADISFYCDDIEQTVAELTARGVEFTGPVQDRGYGLVTFFHVPGDDARLRALLGDPHSFTDDSGEKKCGGFHPDYAVEWSAGGRTYQALICFGCFEAKIYGPRGGTTYDVGADVQQQFKELLATYRKNRPPYRETN